MERLNISEARQTTSPRQSSSQQNGIVSLIAMITKELKSFLEEASMCESPDRRNGLLRTFRTAVKEFEQQGVNVGGSRRKNRQEQSNRADITLCKKQNAGKKLSEEELQQLVTVLKAKGLEVSNKRNAALKKLQQLKQKLAEAQFISIRATSPPILQQRQTLGPA